MTFDPDVPCTIMETRGCIDPDSLAAGNAALDAGDTAQAQRIIDSGDLEADHPCLVVCTRFGVEL